MKATGFPLLLGLACTSATPPSDARGPTAIAHTSLATGDAPRPPATPTVVDATVVDAPAITTPPVSPTPTQVVAPAEPPPPTELPSPTTPFVAAKRFPANVFAATVDTSRSEWSVDIIDWSIEESSPLFNPLMQEDGTFLDLPPGYAALPKGWAVGDTWTLLTRVGTVPKAVTSYGMMIAGGSGQLFVHVRLGAAPKGAKGPALAFRGSPGKSPPTLQIPKPARPASISAALLTNIHASMVAHFDAESRPLIRRAKLREKDVELYPGRFPGGRTHVIFVRHTVHSDEDTAMLSALLFAKADGTIEFFQQADVLGEVEFFALADLDDDGTDEVVYEDSYHEGWYVKLLHWRGTKAKVRALTGDAI